MGGGVSYFSNATLSVMGMAGVTEVRGHFTHAAPSGQHSKPFERRGLASAQESFPAQISPCQEKSTVFLLLVTRQTACG